MRYSSFFGSLSLGVQFDDHGATAMGAVEIGIGGIPIFGVELKVPLLFGIPWTGDYGIGVYSAVGEYYAGTDKRIAYNSVTGGNAWSRDGKRTRLASGFYRLGGRYIGPGWTSDHWGGGEYDDDSVLPFDLLDNLARVHDFEWNDRNHHKRGTDGADAKLAGDFLWDFLTNPYIGDKVLDLAGVVFFATHGSGGDLSKFNWAGIQLDWVRF